MTDRIEYAFDLDGFVDEIRYYRSLTTIDTDNPPPPTAVLDGSDRTFVDDTVMPDQAYHVIFSSYRNGVEKFSDEITVRTSLSPEYLNPAAYFDADDLVDVDIGSWVCRITGIAVTTSANKPVLSTELGFKTCKFGAASSLTSTNALLANLMTAKSAGSVFIVFKKDVFDTSAQSRRLFNITTQSSTARFAVYADDRTSGNMNKIVVGARRLDSDAYRYLATATTVDTSLHMMYADVNHSTAQFSLNIDGSELATGNTQQGIGATSSSNGGSFILGGGAGNAGFIGHLACVIFFDRTLTASERKMLENWAASKYSLSLSI